MPSLIEQELEARGVAQVIVILKSQGAAAGIPTAIGRGTGGAASAALAAASGPSLAQHFSSSELSLDSQIAGSGLRDASMFGESAAVAGAAASRWRASRKTPPPVRYYQNLGILLGTVDQSGLASLSNDDRVAQVTGAPQISPIWPERVGAAAPPKEAVTWGLKALKVPEFWAQGLTGKGIRVGHLDTGVDGKHPALRTAIIEFAEFDTLGMLVSPTPQPHDGGEHGSHTAGTIAGRPVKGKNIGVAPEADLVSALVIEGGNVVARVLGGMDWALGKGIRILSMSLGFRGWWNNFVPIMEILRSKNVLPVIAVGNEGPGTSRSPGNYPNVVSVGAADEQRLIANFSSSQKFSRTDDARVPDMVGPGVGIVSSTPGGKYKEMDGTSMATPHIAGLAALLMQAEPTATANEVEAAIFKACKRGPSMTENRANRGFPDGIAAYQHLTGKSFPKGTIKGKPVSTKKVGAAASKKASAKKSPAKKAAKSSKKSTSNKR
jgi:subtilisin